MEGKPDRPCEHALRDWMQLEFEPGRHPEISTTATQGPEEVGVLTSAGRSKLSVGAHDIDRTHRVEGQPISPTELADSASQSEATDADRWISSERHRQMISSS